MRELTFKGFLFRYVKSLSAEGTTGLYKLAKEAENKNSRLKAPLFLYVFYSGKESLFLNVINKTLLKTEYEEVFLGKTQENFTDMLKKENPDIPKEYRKVWDSYLSQKNKHQGDDHTKELMRQKIKRLQQKNKITNYRIYKDLNLNPGNFNDWIKNGKEDKISLKNARLALEYMEKSRAQN